MFVLDEGWIVFIVICVAIIIFYIWLFSGQIQKHKEDNRVAKYQQDFIEENNIICTKDLEYCAYGFRCRFIVDDLVKEIYLYSDHTNSTFVTIPYRDLLNISVYEDGMETGSIGGSIIGGIFAGDVGAYLGATRGKNYVTSYKAVIGIRNVAYPKFEFVFFDETKISVNDPAYKQAREFIRDMQVTINAIRSMR